MEAVAAHALRVKRLGDRVAIGERTREPGTDGGAQKRAGHGEAKQPGGRTGPVLDGIDRAIDDGGIEAEQEPSHRG